MNEKTIKTNVLNYYESGRHCAESIAMTLLDVFDKTASKTAGKAASAFGGGIGRSKEDICGALSGGVIALSCLYGRDSGNKNIDELCGRTAEFRKRFIQEFGSSQCPRLLLEVEKRDDLASCRHLTAHAAVILFNLITEYNENEKDL